MEFICINLSSYGEQIGICSLPEGRYDLHGTEHRFGDVDYVLESTHIDCKKGVMYFRRKEGA